MNPYRWITVFAALVVGCSTIGCEAPDPDSGVTSKAMEQRMREMEKRAKDSLPKTQQIALAQKVDPAIVTKAQTELRALNEYQQEPSGKIDMVTVNAIEAFQLRVGLDDDGLLNEITLKRLEEAAKSAPPLPPSTEAPAAAPKS
jgi:peptidoglycan hydrolase-like protein with peptidoglycan-binding domain